MRSDGQLTGLLQFIKHQIVYVKPPFKYFLNFTYLYLVSDRLEKNRPADCSRPYHRTHPSPRRRPRILVKFEKLGYK